MFAKLELSIKLTELELYFYYICKPMTISCALTKPEFVWIFCFNLIFSLCECVLVSSFIVHTIFGIHQCILFYFSVSTLKEHVQNKIRIIGEIVKPL